MKVKSLPSFKILHIFFDKEKTLQKIESLVINIAAEVVNLNVFPRIVCSWNIASRIFNLGAKGWIIEPMRRKVYSVYHSK